MSFSEDKLKKIKSTKEELVSSTTTGLANCRRHQLMLRSILSECIQSLVQTDIKRLEAKIDSMQIHNYIELINQNIDARFQQLFNYQNMWNTYFISMHNQLLKLQQDTDSIIVAMDELILEKNSDADSAETLVSTEMNETSNSTDTVPMFPPTPTKQL